MVDGPEPVRLPARGVSGWGLLPRYRTHGDHGSGPGARHGDPRSPTGDDGPEAVDEELCHHGLDDDCWRRNCHAIRDREEPGHLNRQA